MPDKSTFIPQPTWFRMVNKLWRSSYLLGTQIKLDKDDLIRRARKTTGLQDPGSDFWEEPLDRMLESMNQEAHLSPIGRFISRERLVNMLAIRLRANKYFTTFPEILEQELYPAWVIVGLQRTGTTKLQRLLAVDPDHRAIPSWEAINPVPFFKGDDLPLPSDPLLRTMRDKRIRVARTSVNAVRYMSPGFFAVHPLDALMPEEDVLLLDVAFMSQTTEAMMEVPSYASWLESVDQSPAYAYYVKLLKLMQWFKPARRWILKSPHHLEFPDLVTNHLRDVQFIWPHRTIYESIPSFLSMLTYNHLMFREKVDPNAIARRWIRKTGYVLDKALAYRNQKDHGKRFVDIWYQSLVRDALGELNEVYAAEGGLTPELIDRFKKHEQQNPYQKHGKHHYSLEDFNITKEEIDEHTANYQKFITQKSFITAAAG